MKDHFRGVKSGINYLKCKLLGGFFFGQQMPRFCYHTKNCQNTPFSIKPCVNAIIKALWWLVTTMKNIFFYTSFNAVPSHGEQDLWGSWHRFEFPGEKLLACWLVYLIVPNPIFLISFHFSKVWLGGKLPPRFRASLRRLKLNLFALRRFKLNFIWVEKVKTKFI